MACFSHHIQYIISFCVCQYNSPLFFQISLDHYFIPFQHYAANIALMRVRGFSPIFSAVVPGRKSLMTIFLALFAVVLPFSDRQNQNNYVFQWKKHFRAVQLRSVAHSAEDIGGGRPARGRSSWATSSIARGPAPAHNVRIVEDIGGGYPAHYVPFPSRSRPFFIMSAKCGRVRVPFLWGST